MNIVKHKKKYTKGSKHKKNEEDLTQYVDDHTELIQQAFKCLEPQLLQDMLPHNVKHLANSEVRKMCAEEMLGMSSKGLLSIMDGVKPAHEIKRESSAVSLESISSDEMALELTPSSSTKKVKVEGEKSRKNKKHRKKSKKASHSEDRNLLDLVELEARARAIRAQLNKHQL